MPSGLNLRPTANLRFGGCTECFLEPPRDRGMKLEGMHAEINCSGRRPGGNMHVPLRTPASTGASPATRPPLQGDAKSRCCRGVRVGRKDDSFPESGSLGPVESRRSLAQRDHFAEHPETILEEIDLASFGMVPADRDFAETQAGAVCEIN